MDTPVDPGGLWGPGPLPTPKIFFQNHAVFRQFEGKTPYLEQILGLWPPLAGPLLTKILDPPLGHQTAVRFLEQQA